MPFSRVQVSEVRTCVVDCQVAGIRISFSFKMSIEKKKIPANDHTEDLDTYFANNKIPIPESDSVSETS